MLMKYALKRQFRLLDEDGFWDEIDPIYGTDLREYVESVLYAHNNRTTIEGVKEVVDELIAEGKLVIPKNAKRCAKTKRLNPKRK